jgi:hypothetical protein
VATEPAGEYTIFSGKGNDIQEMRTGLFVHKRIMVVNRAEFVTVRTSYIVRRDSFDDVIVLNLHVQTVDNIVGFEVSSAVAMKNAIFWDSLPCDCFKNRRCS